MVIASLTRSNPDSEIGFLAQPERLNVLLSRARNGMIIFGSASTFKHARQGKDVWSRFFQLLEDGGNMYQGLPIKCEKHPTSTVLLRAPENFEGVCPDGRCTEICKAEHE